VKRIARAIVLAPILAYQRFISPALPRRCKYYPTCSEYAVDAIGQLGIVRGTILAAWRVLRCNPWSHGGYDPVDDQTLFRDRSKKPAHRHVVPPRAAQKRTRSGAFCAYDQKRTRERASEASSGS
jgi:putative membrane protein insertion efficiency factor